MVGERLDVALQNLDAAAIVLHVLGLARLVNNGLHESNHAPNRDKAFAHLGIEIALLADFLEEIGQIEWLLAGLAARGRAAVAEGLARGFVHNEANPFKMISG